MVAGSEEHIKFFNSDVLCYLSGININGQQKWVQRYGGDNRKEKDMSEIQSRGLNTYAAFCLEKNKKDNQAFACRHESRCKGGFFCN